MRLAILLLIVTAIHANGHDVNKLESDMMVNKNGNLQQGMVKRQWKAREIPQFPVTGTTASVSK